MQRHIAPRFPGWLTPTSTTASSKEPVGRGIDCRSPIGFTTIMLIQELSNPPRIADLVNEEEETTVFSIVHDDGPFP